MTDISAGPTESSTDDLPPPFFPRAASEIDVPLDRTEGVGTTTGGANLYSPWAGGVTVAPPPPRTAFAETVSKQRTVPTGSPAALEANSPTGHGVAETVLPPLTAKRLFGRALRKSSAESSKSDSGSKSRVHPAAETDGSSTMRSVAAAAMKGRSFRRGSSKRRSSGMGTANKAAAEARRAERRRLKAENAAFVRRIEAEERKAWYETGEPSPPPPPPPPPPCSAARCTQSISP